MSDMRRQAIKPYLLLIGMAMGHDEFTDDNRLVVNHAAKQIMRITEHGGAHKPDPIIELAREIEEGKV